MDQVTDKEEKGGKTWSKEWGAGVVESWDLIGSGVGIGIDIRPHWACGGNIDTGASQRVQLCDRGDGVGHIVPKLE